MRRIIPYILLLISSLTLAQEKELERADMYFNSFNYSKAIKAYQSLITHTDHSYYCTKMIALSYMKSNQPHEAITWFKNCLDFDEVENSIHLMLGQELLKLKRIDEASGYFNKFYQDNATPHQLVHQSFSEFYQGLLVDTFRYKIIPLTINSKYDEYGPSLINSEMIFTSNRPLPGITNHRDVNTNKGFFNLFAVDKTSTKAILYSKALQSKYNDGPICFSKDASTAYITRNSESVKKQVNALDIYVVDYDKNDWSKSSKSLPIRKGNYSVAHAALSPDNKRLYFASNMPGGFGGMDLYVCALSGGFISQPINLGSTINTPGNEVFPFIDKNGWLYFASDTHPGMGGYDVFFSKPVKEMFSSPFNLGYPLNTSYDDFSLILDETNTFGFFASNREGGKGGDDLYAIHIHHPLDFSVIRASIFNSSDSIAIEEAKVRLIENDKNQILNIIADKEGQFNCYLKKDKNYTIEVNHNLYSDFKGVVNSEQLQQSDTLNFNIGLQKN